MAPEVTNSPRTITVTLVVAASSPVTASPSSLTFTTSPGVAPPARSVAVSDSGGRSFTATASGAWLSVTPSSGTMPASLTISVNPAGLSQTIYSGAVTVQVTREDNSIFPLVIPVTLNVVMQNELSVTPGSLRYYAWAGTVVALDGQLITATLDQAYTIVDPISDVPWLAAGYRGCDFERCQYQPYLETSNLPPGQYTGKLTFSSVYASNGPQTVTVNLTVLAPAPITLTPGSISFQYLGAALPAAQTLSVTAPAATPFTAAVAGGQWLSISPSSGVTPGALTLTANPTGLAAGTYTATVTVTITHGGVTLPVPVPVTLTIGQPWLQVSSQQLSFTFDPGGLAPPAQVLTISSSDEAITQTVTTTVWTDSGGNWLEVSPAAGSTPLATQVSVKAGGLAVGSYTGHISFASAGAGNSPRLVNVTLRVGPVLRAAPSSLTFSYLPGAAAPQAQTVLLDSSAPTAFSATTAVPTSWLRITPSSATTPATVTLSVDPTGLPAGSYTASVYFTSTTALNNQAGVSVRLDVGPRISLLPGILEFGAERGSTAPPSQTVSLATGSRNLSYRVITGAGADWLGVTPAAGLTPATLTVTANPSGLSAGTYSGSVVVSAPDSADQSVTMPVTLRVGARLSASQASLSFQSVANGPVQFSQLIAISTGATASPFSAAGYADGGWLSVNPQSGTTPGSIVAAVNPAGLVPGNYSGTIYVSATGAINGLTIPVSLTVGGGGAANLSVMPAALSFTSQLNGQPPAAQMITVTSPALTPISAAATGGNWLVVTPSTGMSPLNFQVSVNAAGLAAGVYTAYVALSSGPLVAQTVPVTLIVQEGPQLLLSASSLAFSAAPEGASPPFQTVEVASTGGPIAYRATSSAGWLSVSPASGRTNGPISISVNPAALKPGNYDAAVSLAPEQAGIAARTITVRLTISSLPQLTVSPTTINLGHIVGNEPPGPATMVLFSDNRLSYSVQAASSGWLSANRTSGRAPDLLEVSADPDGLKPGVYTGTLTVASAGSANSQQVVTVRLTVKSPAPVVSPSGIVSAASYLYGAIAPGSLISIFGENLAPGTMSAEASPWPTT